MTSDTRYTHDTKTAEPPNPCTDQRLSLDLVKSKLRTLGDGGVQKTTTPQKRFKFGAPIREPDTSLFERVKTFGQSDLESPEVIHGSIRIRPLVETPTTITLRKASNMNESCTISQHNPRASISPMKAAVEPPTQISSSKQGATTDHGRIEATSGIDKTASLEGLTKAYADEPSKINRRQSKVVSDLRLFAFSGQRRKSEIAETAITFADVQTTSYSPLGDSQSRKNSLSNSTVRHRQSVVQICSRKSVHEVIWNEDDTPSSWTSASPVKSTSSPEGGSCSSELGSSPEEEDVPDLSADVAAMTRKVSHQSKASTYSLRTKVKGMKAHDILKTPFGMAEWTWGPEQSLVCDSPTALTDEIVQDAPSKPSSQPTSTNPEHVAFVPSIDSFPPLMDRRRTSDWQKFTLPDLNDPTSGQPVLLPRIEEPSVSYDSIAKSQDKGVCTVRDRTIFVSQGLNNNVETRKKPIKLHPCAPPRMGNESGEGCAVGTSTHVRRSSVLMEHKSRRSSDNNNMHHNNHARRSVVGRRRHSSFLNAVARPPFRRMSKTSEPPSPPLLLKTTGVEEEGECHHPRQCSLLSVVPTLATPSLAEPKTISTEPFSCYLSGPDRGMLQGQVQGQGQVVMQTQRQLPSLIGIVPPTPTPMPKDVAPCRSCVKHAPCESAIEVDWIG